MINRWFDNVKLIECTHGIVADTGASYRVYRNDGKRDTFSKKEHKAWKDAIEFLNGEAED